MQGTKRLLSIIRVLRVEVGPTRGPVVSTKGTDKVHLVKHVEVMPLNEPAVIKGDAAVGRMFNPVKPAKGCNSQLSVVASARLPVCCKNHVLENEGLLSSTIGFLLAS